jgi:8-oxo-dGTP diphosphatase
MSDIESKESISPKQGVIFAICRNGEIVLQKRLNPNKSYYGHILVPGGKVEIGETLEEALIREVKEETGVIAKTFKFIDNLDVITDKGECYSHNLFLITDFDGEIEENREADSQIFIVKFSEAKQICELDLSQRILKLIESKLSG